MKNEMRQGRREGIGQPSRRDSFRKGSLLAIYTYLYVYILKCGWWWVAGGGPSDSLASSCHQADGLEEGVEKETTTATGKLGCTAMDMEVAPL